MGSCYLCGAVGVRWRQIGLSSYFGRIGVIFILFTLSGLTDSSDGLARAISKYWGRGTPNVRLLPPTGTERAGESFSKTHTKNILA